MTPRLCPSCKLEHPALQTCGGLTVSQDVPPHPTRDVREAAWGIVKSRELRKEHPHAYAWARAYLGLEDREQVVGSRRTHGEGFDD